ncbi:MAG: LCP family protein [Anaerotignum sp.]|nr:LCP family protein [Anaerotignum sp.]
MSRRSPKKRKKFNPVKTFFKIVISMVMAFVVLAGGACFAYYKATGNTPFSGGGVMNAGDMSILDALMGKNIKLNVAVFGVDKDETRTDVAFVVHYDSEQESIQLISVPRDTRVNVCDEVEDLLGKSYGVTKFNAVHAFGGKEHGPEAAILQLEDLLGISIDHYVKVNFDALVEIVDAVGGVEVDVPQDMYWDMSDTGDITINLKKGLQTLDGDHALQLVRFRRYAEGDVGRIQVQQLFLKALAEKVLSTESIVTNLGDYIKVMYKYVKTDVSLSDAMKYANYITKIDMEKISMETLPGAGQYVGGVSYFIHDPAATREMVDRVFYSVAPVLNEDGSVDSKSLLIEVANGGEVAGLAGRFTEKLANEGFRLVEPTTYHGEQMDYTRIQVKTEGAGKDLVKYFDKARVESAPSDMGSADIRIILGTNEG